MKKSRRNWRLVDIKFEVMKARLGFNDTRYMSDLRVFVGQNYKLGKLNIEQDSGLGFVKRKEKCTE